MSGAVADSFGRNSTINCPTAQSSVSLNAGSHLYSFYENIYVCVCVCGQLTFTSLGSGSSSGSYFVYGSMEINVTGAQ